MTRFTNLSPLTLESIKALRDWAPASGFSGVDLVHPVSLIRCEAKVLDIRFLGWRGWKHRSNAEASP